MTIEKLEVKKAMIRLQVLFMARAVSTAVASQKSDNLATRENYKGQAYAFRSAAGYCDAELAKLEVKP